MVDDEKYRLDDFELYNLARKSRNKVYKLIKQLLPEEHYCLEPQMRKAIVSVTNNIAEGHGAGIIKKISSFVGFRGAPSKRYLTISMFAWMKDMAKRHTMKHLKRMAML